ncbi:MAG: hypothetical protein EKK49_08365 [Rhodocyclaceae bacterium]|nr:MAG: hypothetical protein EKK49_08365 [Rhodocyclaceae bacterium]
MPDSNLVEKRLAAVTALWTAYREILRCRTPLEGQVQATVAGVAASSKLSPIELPALDASVDVFLPAQGRPLTDLEGDRRRNEVVSNSIILIVIGLGREPIRAGTVEARRR